MYDPSTVRFLSKDPIEDKGGSPNLYLYCRNDPVNRTDPNGMGEPPVVPGFFTALREKDRDGKWVITFDTWIRTFGNSRRSEKYWDDLVGANTGSFTEEWLNRLLTEDYRGTQREQLKVINAYYTILATGDEAMWDAAKALAEGKPHAPPVRVDTSVVRPATPTGNAAPVLSNPGVATPGGAFLSRSVEGMSIGEAMDYRDLR